MVGIGHFDEFRLVNLNRARLELDNFALPGEIVSPLAVNLDGGKTGRDLLDGARKARQQGT